MCFNLIIYDFYCIRAVSAPMHPPEEPIVVFRPDKARSNEQDETFQGNLNVYDELNAWVTEKCVPLVREITFENAEELTEEGIPFLILFHKPDDNDSVKKFNDVVRNELMSEKSKFLTCAQTRACVMSEICFYRSSYIYLCVCVCVFWEFIIDFSAARMLMI